MPKCPADAATDADLHRPKLALPMTETTMLPGVIAIMAEETVCLARAAGLCPCSRELASSHQPPRQRDLDTSGVRRRAKHQPPCSAISRHD